MRRKEGRKHGRKECEGKKEGRKKDTWTTDGHSLPSGTDGEGLRKERRNDITEGRNERKEGML